MTAIQYFGYVDPQMRFIGPSIGGDAKFMGLALASNGNLYCCPYNHPKVLKINPDTGTVTQIGPDLLGNGKWWGIAAHTNGKLYCAPNGRSSFLEIDPLSDTVAEISSPFNEARGISFHPNGKMYCWRRGVSGIDDRNKLIEFDPSSGIIVLKGTGDLTDSAGGNFRGTILGKDNKIYNSVGNRRKIYRYDPISDTVETFNTNNIGGNNSHWGMCVSKDNDNIYYAPHIDESHTSWYPMSTGVYHEGTGYHITQTGGGNCFAIAPAPNGSLFSSPAQDLFVTRHTIENGNDSPFGFNLGTTFNKYAGIKAAGNGKLYLAPYNMSRVLEIYDVGEFNSFSEVYSFHPVTNEPTVYMRGL